jgi:hypothetical protein
MLLTGEACPTVALFNLEGVLPQPSLGLAPPAEPVLELPLVPPDAVPPLALPLAVPPLALVPPVLAVEPPVPMEPPVPVLPPILLLPPLATVPPAESPPVAVLDVFPLLPAPAAVLVAVLFPPLDVVLTVAVLPPEVLFPPLALLLVLPVPPAPPLPPTLAAPPLADELVEAVFPAEALDDELPLPALSLLQASPTARHRAREPWRIDELRWLFDMTAFPSCEDPTLPPVHRTPNLSDGKRNRRQRFLRRLHQRLDDRAALTTAAGSGSPTPTGGSMTWRSQNPYR